LQVEQFARRLRSAAIAVIAGTVALVAGGAEVGAQDAIKIGVLAPLTGSFAENQGTPT
jgi:hypothetical protein